TCHRISFSLYYALPISLPCLKTMLRDAAMVMGSWVRGLMPCRSARSRTSKVPKPEMVTFSPLASARLRASNTAFTALSASFLVMSVFAATCAVRSALVIKWYLQKSLFCLMSVPAAFQRLAERLGCECARFLCIEARQPDGIHRGEQHRPRRAGFCLLPGVGACGSLPGTAGLVQRGQGLFLPCRAGAIAPRPLLQLLGPHQGRQGRRDG